MTTTIEHVHTDACTYSSGALCGGGMYLARVHRPYAKKMELVGKQTRSKRVAVKRLTDAMLSNGFAYDRGDVVMLADYYEPMPVYEVKTR